MTREELIKSDEYLTATVECIVVSRKPVRKMRNELNKFFLDWKAELLSVMQPNSEPQPPLPQAAVSRSVPVEEVNVARYNYAAEYPTEVRTDVEEAHKAGQLFIMRKFGIELDYGHISG